LHDDFWRTGERGDLTAIEAEWPKPPASEGGRYKGKKAA
jgi:hypothetical protein